MGWPSWSTLCTVMSALNVCTSSARIGCLERGRQLRGSRVGRVAHSHFHARPERLRALVVPCVDDAAADMFAWAEVSLCSLTQVIVCVRFGAVSSATIVSTWHSHLDAGLHIPMLVAFRMLIWSSCSCLCCLLKMLASEISRERRGRSGRGDTGAEFFEDFLGCGGFLGFFSPRLRNNPCNLLERFCGVGNVDVFGREARGVAAPALTERRGSYIDGIVNV